MPLVSYSERKEPGPMYKNIKAVSTAHRALIADSGVRSLLADPLSNPKVAKNGKLGVLTAPLHLAPAGLSGFNTCAQASAGCRAACLHTAGNPAAMPGKIKARIARTRLYFTNRPAFLALLVSEIQAHVANAKRQEMEPAIRLNATSDIPFERVPVVVAGETFPNLMAAFPEVQFYDYTKITKRAVACAARAPGWPVNYHLTFSLTEANEHDAGEVIAMGGNVAVVFDTRRGKPLPSSYILDGFKTPVVDADEHDFRPVDGSGVISGLRAKGRAIGDDSGFVRAA